MPGPGPGELAPAPGFWPHMPAPLPGACKILKWQKNLLIFEKIGVFYKKSQFLTQFCAFFSFGSNYEAILVFFQAFQGRKIFIFRGIKQKFQAPAVWSGSRPRRNRGPGTALLYFDIFPVCPTLHVSTHSIFVTVPLWNVCYVPANDFIEYFTADFEKNEPIRKTTSNKKIVLSKQVNKSRPAQGQCFHKFEKLSDVLESDFCHGFIFAQP